MSKEKRTIIDRELCEKVRVLMLHGLGPKKTAEMLGIGKATVYRIKDAGYDPERYNVNRKQEQRQAEPQEVAEEQVPGQMEMELVTAEKKTDGSMMRFQAAMVDRLISELDKINDTLNMFLRVMRHE